MEAVTRNRLTLADSRYPPEAANRQSDRLIAAPMLTMPTSPRHATDSSCSETACRKRTEPCCWSTPRCNKVQETCDRTTLLRVVNS
jgi:hypothetical protein